MVMEVFGIKFVPWNTPLHDRLASLAAGGFLVYAFPFVILGPWLIYYVIFYTSLWPIVVMYLFWLYVVDIDTPEQGGRRSEWMRSLRFWVYIKNYFPVSLVKPTEVELDPKRNYLFAAFPHGIIATGATLAFGTEACGFSNVFPHHNPKLIILDQNFKIPIYRDIMLIRGCCPSSPKSLNFLLGNPNGGYMVLLFVGGVAELMNAHPGVNEVVVKNRKGFVKLALKNGSPLVPVYSFGENDIYSQPPNPKGSWIRRFQEWSKRKTSFVPFCINGRGIFQYNFGFIPRQHPINVVVGKPIEVAKVENPTQEDIDALHKKFIEELINLFEENKHKYIKDADSVELVVS